MPGKYSSFFVNTNVLSNGEINYSSQIDPLFLLLPKLQQLISSRFSPFDQLTSEIDDDNLTNHLTEKILAKVCEVNDSMGDDMLLYKYSEVKTITWLSSKFERVNELLVKKAKVAAGRKSNAFGDSFTLSSKEDEKKDLVVAPSENNANILNQGDKPTTTTNSDNKSENTLSTDLLNTIKLQAVTIICEYLQESTTKLICKKILSNENALTIANKTIDKKRKNAWEVGVDTEAEKLIAYSLGSAQLFGTEENKVSKVSTGKETTKEIKDKKAAKNMKSLSSFFGGAPKKPKAK